MVPIDKPAPKGRLILPQQQVIRDALEAGARAVDALRDGDRALVAEGCTHRRQCEDIGTVKLPRWIEARTGVKPACSFPSGTQFPKDLSPCRMVIHCGGCTLNGREMQYRLACALLKEAP